MKRVYSLILICAVLLLPSCGLNFSKEKVFIVSEATVHNSFYKETKSGLYEFCKNNNMRLSVKNCKDSQKFLSVLEDAGRNGNLVWGCGSTFYDDSEKAAELNTNSKYVVLDKKCESDLPNLYGVVFNTEESSFLVGYIAGMKTDTNKIGFIGGVDDENIKTFEYGFRSGVKIASVERDCDIIVVSEFVDSYSDKTKAKNIGDNMYMSDVDIIYQVAGEAGLGVIESAVDNNKWVIGVDTDQSELAPKNVLTSSLKACKSAANIVSEDILLNDAREAVDNNYYFGIDGGYVGIPEHHENFSDELYLKVIEFKKMIESNKIDVPKNEKEFEIFESVEIN